MKTSSGSPDLSRRTLLKTGALAGTLLALGGLPVFAARAGATPRRAGTRVPPMQAITLRFATPASEAALLQQGLPVGNGRIGALVGGDPARELLYIADVSLWTGGINDTVLRDGQRPYDERGSDFGAAQLLARASIEIPAHAMARVQDYRRELDLSNGLASTRYRLDGVVYRREVYASHPDDLIVVHLSQSGGGRYSGSVALAGTHGEVTVATDAAANFTGSFANGLRYACLAQVAARDGQVRVDGDRVHFSDCSEALLVFSGGTNYADDFARSYRDPALNPLALARDKAAAALRHGAESLLAEHLADWRPQFEATTLDLGASSAAQRAMHTPQRLAARAQPDAPPDPELEAAYLQFGRYLMLSGSRDSLPINLQGPWLVDNAPPWHADYHTDVNLQMNYWLPDRLGLSPCFDALANYCIAQLPAWTDATRRLFNHPRNRFRNSSGKLAGWTTSMSHNIHGGGGWWWHPAGNAWLCGSLFDHYRYTLDRAYLAKIHPLLKGACEFWQARLLDITVTDAQGQTRQVLIDDADWSPEHGPDDARGISYAQELVWQLFADFEEAAAVLGVDADFAATVRDLRQRLYLPEIHPHSGELQEWMSPDVRGEKEHRHLSHLVGLFPGDRIAADTAPLELLAAARKALEARGMRSYGWSMAWRAACWARLKDADRAYRSVLNVLLPSQRDSNGTAINFFDMYRLGRRAVFQIDANFGVPVAMAEMLLYSRPGLIELLPAAPKAWTAAGQARGLGARGGFVIDLQWCDHALTEVTVRSIGGTRTLLRWGSWQQEVALAPGQSATFRP